MTGKQDSAVPVSSSGENEPLLQPPTYTSATGKPTAGPSGSNGPSPIAQLPLPATHNHESANRDADRRARKRVFYAWLWAMGLWLVFTGTLARVIGESMDDGNGNHRHRHDHGFPAEFTCCASFDPAQLELPPPAVLARIAEESSKQQIVAPSTRWGRGNDTTRHQTEEWVLPIADLDNFYIETSGGYTKGQVQLGGMGMGDMVEVVAVARYAEGNLLGESKLCVHRSQLEDGTSKSGLKLVTPLREPGDYEVEFNIIVTFPRSLEHLASLSINAPRFTIRSDNSLRNTFGSIDVASEDAPIVLDSLDATGPIKLATTNAPIQLEGPVKGFNIDLSTTNGRIEGNSISENIIKARTVDSGIHGSYSMNDNGLLIISTTNGPIDIDVLLLPSDKSKSDKLESYKVSAESTNGRVDIKFTEQPQDSYLACKARTTNAKVEVKLDPQFQGKFYGHTINGKTQLEGPLTTTNPISGSTERHLQSALSSPFPHLESTIEGTVWWEDDATRVAQKGDVVVQSVNGGVGIVLQ